MKTRAEQLDRIFLWILLVVGLMMILFYVLSSFLGQPTVETITTHAPSVNSNNNSTQEIKFQPRKSK